MLEEREPVISKSLTESAEEVIAITDILLTQEGNEVVVVSNAKLILCHIICGKIEISGELLRIRTITRKLHPRRTTKTITCIVTDLNTNVGSDLEILKRSQSQTTNGIHIEIVIRRGILGHVVLRVVDPKTGDRLIKVLASILLVRGVEGRIEHRSKSRIGLAQTKRFRADTSHAVRHRGIDTYLNVIVKCAVYVQSCADLGVLRSRTDTLLIEISQGEVVISIGRTAGDTDILLVHRRLLVVVLPPLGIIIAILVTKLLSKVCLSDALVEAEKLTGIHQLVVVADISQRGNTVLTTDGDVCALGHFASLGRDVDDTIGSTCTIDRCCRCILQELHTLKVVRIESLDKLHGHRHTIQNIERRRACCERSYTVEVYRGDLTRLTG